MIDIFKLDRNRLSVEVLKEVFSQPTSDVYELFGRLRGDLLDEAFVNQLPEAEHVVFMAEMKFGATGNVYGMSPIHDGVSVQTDAAYHRYEKLSV